MKDGLNTSNHAAYSLHYHIILTVKYRHKCITSEMMLRLKKIFADVCHSWRCKLVEFGCEADHVHLLVDAHPSMDLSRFIGNGVFQGSCPMNFLRPNFSSILLIQFNPVNVSPISCLT